jgi:hypothetical protein
VKIEFSPKQLISWLLSTLATLLVTQICSKPLSLAGDWFLQFIPSLAETLHFCFLAQMLHFGVFLSCFICYIIFYGTLAWFLVHICFNIKKIQTMTFKMLVLNAVSILIMILGTTYCRNTLTTFTVFEHKLIIFSSKLTPNEIGAYKAKWLMMETSKDFANLKTKMEQDAKKYQLKFREHSFLVL